MHSYQFLIARINGKDIAAEMESHLALVKKGIAGFIIFGGELEEARDVIRRLQSEAKVPLITSSDLERGLGQQLRGGTALPPARVMGRASMHKPELVRHAYDIMAAETAYAGINTVFAPVLDIDSNPLNPIISTRAFGNSAQSVTGPALAMMEALRKYGITSCGKHFPGHGDTGVDSHLGLPVLNKTIQELEGMELLPFMNAIRAELPMVMTAHMSVPALDPEGTPVTLSAKAISYLRQMGFNGLITTDALDMGALREFGEARAALMALEAGADILLHPSKPDKLAMELKDKCENFQCRLNDFRRSIKMKEGTMPEVSPDLAASLTRLALRIDEGYQRQRPSSIIALTDDGDSPAAKEMARLLGIKAIIINTPKQAPSRAEGHLLCLSSDIRGYKGGSSAWIKEAMKPLMAGAAGIVSFGPEALLEDANELKCICAYWDSTPAGRAVYEEIYA